MADPGPADPGPTDPGLADTVEVWLIRTDLPDRVLAGLEPLLDDTERQRAGALLQAAERGRFVAAHGAARLLIGAALGAPPAQLRWRYGPHGKPELTGPWTGAQVSLSHSGDLAALALTARRRVGVDLQRLLPGGDVAGMARRFYPPGDARFVLTGGGAAGRAERFTRLWTRKEACVKVGGGRLVPGLRLPVCSPDQIGADQAVPDQADPDQADPAQAVPARIGPIGADHMVPDEAGPGQLVAADPAGSLPGPLLVRDVPVPAGYYAAVALEGPLPYRVTRHWWPGGRPAS
jgi:4'-phosphopantetheinyl transferase